MQQPPPPPDNGEGMDPTIAIPRVEAQPPPQHVEHGVLEPPLATVVPPPHAAVPPERPGYVPPYPVPPGGLPPHPVQRVAGPFAAAPPIPPPASVVVPERPRFVFGNPAGYTFARFVAFAIDFGLVTVIVTTLSYAVFAINPLTGLPSNNEAGFDTTLAIGAGIALLYMWLAEAIFGTTIGKLSVGLHVYALRGRFVGIGRSLIRNLLRPIDLLVIGGILALLPGHRRLGDLLGGTVVARSPLRSFAPLVGWILIIVLVGAPFLVAGTERALAGFFAFGMYVPALATHAWQFIYALIGGAAPGPR